MSSNSPGVLIVQVKDVSHRFPETDLLYEHVNFELETGQTLAVTGPSGSGKSTLLSLIACWEKPYSGRVDIRKGSRVCWVFQNPYGPKYRTVRDIASSLSLLTVCQGHRQMKRRKRLLLSSV